MRKSSKIITPNTTAPVDLATIKLFCKVDTNDDDAVLGDLISSAKIAYQKYTNSFLLETTIEQQQDSFEQTQASNFFDILPLLSGLSITNTSAVRYIELLYSPVISITSVKVTDIDNNETTISSSDYVLDNAGRIIFSNNLLFSNLREVSAFKVTYKTGFGTAASDIPTDILLGLKAHVLTAYNASSLKAKEAIAFDAFGLPDSVKSIYQSYLNINGI